MITERPLPEDELAELREAAEEPASDDLDAWIDALRDDPDDDGIFALGAWWGMQVAAITGWAWVTLVLGEGMEAPALVSPDRGVAVLPLQLAAGAVEGDPAEATDLADVLERLRSGARPTGPAGSYAIVA